MDQIEKELVLRLLLGASLSVLVSLLVTGTAFSQQDDDVVSATVSAQAVAISVTPDSIDYGVVPFADSRKSNTAEAGNVTFTATNEGNVPSNFAVRGAHATGDGFQWNIQQGLLGCPSTTQNQYRHRVDPGTIFLTHNTNQVLQSNVAPDGEVPFTTEIYLPCPGSGGAGEIASTSITVIATAS
jgi:hypothetical protein